MSMGRVGQICTNMASHRGSILDSAAASVYRCRLDMRRIWRNGKKPGRQLEILLPVMGKPGEMSACAANLPVTARLGMLGNSKAE
jgi:hypothetical protein